MYSRGMIAESGLETAGNRFFQGTRLQYQAATVRGEKIVQPDAIRRGQLILSILNQKIGEIILRGIGNLALACDKQFGIG